MNSRFIWFGIGILVVIFVAAISWGLLKSSPTEAGFRADDPNRPQVEISQTQFDLGQMKQSEERTVEAIVKNPGRSPLQVSDLSTSCDCTFAQMDFGDHQSPELSMHSGHWHDEIPAGGQATLKIIYRPAVMPVTGKVERTVFFKTNDPNQLNVEVTLTAEVNP